ncbi:hypothetical protein O181_074439 [Austropuccinia psidii MF-1]|uniref:Integrase catalytic domain-containing protein n=1 Tax=Austropuccinia psidii MF-1 TaxID=1389203 RepID=A0A9Q3F923_9BASI|nr:hypothetical protein [Austropuccinia psidii MF-1]
MTDQKEKGTSNVDPDDIATSSCIRRQLETESLGLSLTPHLDKDGSNFHQWSRSLCRLVENIFDYESYFSLLEKDNNCSCNRQIQTFIEKSIHPYLRCHADDEDEARKLFGFLRDRFDRLSWSKVMNLWGDLINGPDPLQDINGCYSEIRSLIRRLKAAILGGFTEDNLLAIIFHYRCQQYFNDIANALDGKLAINRSAVIMPKEVLEIAERMMKQSTSSNQAVIMAAATSSMAGKQSGGASPKSRPQLNARSKEWILRNITPDKPCFWCFEWGHWKQDCPIQLAGKPKCADPRLKNPGLKLKKSAFLSHPALAKVEVFEDEDYFEAHVAAVEDMKVFAELVLLDSGTTHHVTSNQSLFRDFRPINISLSVATAAKYPVVGVGTAVFGVKGGTIILRRTLFCPDISGTVLSLGRFQRCDGGMKFVDGIFQLIQDDVIYDSKPLIDRWYIEMVPRPSCSAMKTCLFDPNLLHQRFVHFSLRMIARMQKLDAVKGLPSKPWPLVNWLCESCSFAKSTHRPFECESRGIVNAPGDVIVIDLVGPFPISVQRHLYGLVIQDHYSSLVSFVPLRSKGEATKAVLGWLRSFDVLSGHKVKRVRSDNAGEFTSNAFEDGLLDLGITHERTIPYEHHHNGKVERVNRTFSEAARAIMLEKNVDIGLWPWAFRHVAWVFNRKLHADFVQTPWELVTGNKPNVSILRVFGCVAYVHDPLHKKDLAAKSRKLIYMGVAQDVKGWLFWCPIKKNFVKSLLAVFDERGVWNKYRASKAIIKAINIERVEDDSMIKEIEAQDNLFSLMSMDMHIGSGAPASYNEAMKSDQKVQWEVAMREELNSLEEMRVWQEVSPHGIKNVLGSRWVYALKTNEAGDIVRFKARAVVQGHRQIKGISFEETFAPTPTFQSLRGLIAIASAYRWQVATFDVKTAYLNSHLEEEVYIRPPPGKVMNVPGNILRLKRAVYGLKQAARCWWMHIAGILRGIGFTPNEGDQSTYSYSCGGDTALLWIHVDDGILVASTQELMARLRNELSVSLQLKWDVDLHSIVGIDVQRVGQQFRLSQHHLIKKLLIGHTNNFSPKQPLPNLELKSDQARQADRAYLSKVGMILYLAQVTRPDVMFAINYLARFSVATNERHWWALKHLISYLAGTIDDVLVIESDLGRKAVEMFVDANWAGEGRVHGIGFWGEKVFMGNR